MILSNMIFGIFLPIIIGFCALMILQSYKNKINNSLKVSINAFGIFLISLGTIDLLVKFIDFYLINSIIAFSIFLIVLILLLILCR